MKRITAIALVVVMSLQCFYKLGVITYFQINRDYIGEVLCINKEKPITMCYGQCFLEKNLELAEKAGSEKGPVPVNKQTIDFPVFLVAEISYSFNREQPAQTANSNYTFYYYPEFVTTPFRPPALCA